MPQPKSQRITGASTQQPQLQTSTVLAFVVNSVTFPPTLHAYIVDLLRQRAVVELYARVDDYSDMVKPLRFGVALVVQANFQGQIVGAYLKHAPDANVSDVVERDMAGAIPLADYDAFNAFWEEHIFTPSWPDE